MATEKQTDDREPCTNGPNSLREIRKEHIEHVLHDTGHNFDETAKILGISVTELRRWVRKLRLTQ